MLGRLKLKEGVVEDVVKEGRLGNVRVVVVVKEAHDGNVDSSAQEVLKGGDVG
jgi:hypothetical protein